MAEKEIREENLTIPNAKEDIQWLKLWLLIEMQNFIVISENSLAVSYKVKYLIIK